MSSFSSSHQKHPGFRADISVPTPTDHQNDVVSVSCSHVSTFAFSPRCLWFYNFLLNLSEDFNKIAIQATAQMAADKEDVGLSRVDVYESYEIIVYSILKPS